MKLTCAAYLAFAGLALAQGDDDLGLPQLNVPLAEPETVAASGYFVNDGVVYALVGERAVPLDRDVTLRVTPRKIIGFDGRQMRMPVGMMYMSDGSIAPLPVPPQEPAKPVESQTNSKAVATEVEQRDVAPNVGTTSRGVSIQTPLRPTDPLPPGPIPVGTSTQVTGQSPLSTATIPPPQPGFASPVHPDRTGPLADTQRPVDRTRPESVPNGRYFDTTRVPDQAHPQDRTRVGTDDAKYRDRTNQGPDNYRHRDRTNQGPDDERAPDPTRRPDR